MSHVLIWSLRIIRIAISILIYIIGSRNISLTFLAYLILVSYISSCINSTCSSSWINLWFDMFRYHKWTHITIASLWCAHVLLFFCPTSSFILRLNSLIREFDCSWCIILILLVVIIWILSIFTCFISTCAVISLASSHILTWMRCSTCRSYIMLCLFHLKLSNLI